MIDIPLDSLYNFDAEESLIASSLVVVEQLDIMIQCGVSHEHFHPKYQPVVRIMIEQRTKGGHPDPITVEDQMKAEGADLCRIKELSNNGSLLVNSSVPGLCGIIKGRFTTRRACECAYRVIQNASSYCDPSTLLAEMEKCVKDCTEQKAEKPLDLADTITKYQDGEMRSIGVWGADNADYDVFSPSLVTIAGRPSMGKTSFATHIGMHLSNSGIKTSIYSMEDTMEMLSLRMLSSMTGIQTCRMRRKAELKPFEWDKIASKIDSIGKNNNLLIRCGPKNLRTLMSSVKDDVKNGTKVVIIDYLQLISGLDSNNMNAAVGGATKRLAEATREHGITIFVLSQLNRQVEQRDDKRPRMSDLRDSGSIEQDCDSIWFVYRPSYYEKSKNPNKALIIIGKNRNGPVGEIEIPVCLRYGAWGEKAKELIRDSIWRQEEESE